MANSECCSCLISVSEIEASSRKDVLPPSPKQVSTTDQLYRSGPLNPHEDCPPNAKQQCRVGGDLREAVDLEIDT